MVSQEKIEKLSDEYYEKWKDPHSKDNYTAEDMRRAFEQGMMEAIRETLDFLKKKDMHSYIESLSTGVGSIRFIKDELLSDIKKYFKS